MATSIELRSNQLGPVHVLCVGVIQCYGQLRYVVVVVVILIITKNIMLVVAVAVLIIFHNVVCCTGVANGQYITLRACFSNKH